MADQRRPSEADIEQMDEEELANFGYKQELRRDWGLLHNFGISFSIIVSSTSLPLQTSTNKPSQSVITGITTLFSYGLVTGGPGVMSVGQ
jgi:hypothetical protein